MKLNAKWAGLAALAPACGLILALAAAPAHANAILTSGDTVHTGATLTLDDGGANSITLTDGGTGLINYSGTLGSWKLTWETATIEPTLGDSPAPNMHLTAGAYGTGTLNISFKEDDFSGTGSKEFLAGIGGALAQGATLTGSAWLLDGTGTRVAQLANFGPFSSFFSDAQSAAETVGGTYGLEFDGTLIHTQVGTSSFDASVAVPEPGTLALFGAGLAACALVMRRRRTDIARQPMRA